MAKLAIGYVRVSTEGQATEGVSLDAQQAKIQAWCLANDVELGNVFIDAGLSGKRADIATLQRLPTFTAIFCKEQRTMRF